MQNTSFHSVFRNSILSELKKYKRKYYFNILLKGILVTLALVLSVYVLFNTLEYIGRFSSLIRAILFYSFVGLASVTFLIWILVPITNLLNLNKQISDDEAARQIGQYFPEIDDKLLNTLQLQRVSSQDNALLQASIAQRTQSLAIVRFTDAVNLSENRKYLRYVLPPLFILLLLLMIVPQLITESSKRIIFFNTVTPAPDAPFSFHLQNQKLEAFKNEDYTVKLKMDGRTIPQDVYLFSEGRKYKMKAGDKLGEFIYTFKRLQNPLEFNFQAGGFNSSNYEVKLLERPTLLSFQAYLSYPAYLGKTDEELNNIGNLVVPEGTQIKWIFKTNQSDNLSLVFNKKENIEARKESSSEFEYARVAKNSENYQIKLKNEYSENKEEINYYLNVIPDNYPKITMKEFQDKEVYEMVAVGGSISDDYGLSTLKLFYRIDREGVQGNYKSIEIPINKEQTIQNFYYELYLKQFQLKAGDKLFYYAQVWDNDGVNGAKSSRTGVSQFKIPNKKDMEDEIENSAAETEDQMNRVLQKSKELQQDLEDLQNKLRNKDNLDFQDKKNIEELLQRRENLKKELEQTQKQFEQNQEKQDRFFDNSEEIKEKAKQLEQLMEDLLDEETKKLYEELQKLLDQNMQNDQIIQQLDQIEMREDMLEEELERTIEMFKQMQFEQKLEQTQEDLEQLAEEQQELSEKTDEKNVNSEELQQEQQDLNDKFEEIKEDLEELNEMDDDLKKPNGMEDFEQEQQDIQQKQQESMEQLEKNQKNKAKKSQQDAGQKMQEMSEKMQEMQSGMQMDQLQENIDDLRAILENLLTLSFSQEELMKDFREVSLSDPRFKTLAQKQVKLQDDAKIIEDSLLALSQRVFQIQSFVTREVNQMKQYMDESATMIKERKLSVATGKQQFAMTSMNNLALLLDDVLDQMQNQMASAMSMPQKGGKQQSGKPNLSQLQQQLNQQIEDLKKSGKSGRQMSEELARLAAQQERIRRAMQDIEKQLEGQPGNGELQKQLDDLKELMEETEKDLVNKRLSEELLERQKDIETRLLESEKAMRKQEEDEERKGETAEPQLKRIPPNLKEYFQNKKSQIELLKTIPPTMSPYYKKEVDEYFEKIDN